LDLAPGKSLIATCNDDTATSLPTFRSYNQRWCVAAAVFCVVGSNYAHRLSFAAVNSKAAAFYETSNQSMKYIIAISTLSSILSCVSAPLLVSIYGLRFGVHIGAVLTCLGNFLCWLSTFPILTTAVPDSNVWYWLTMTGQFFSGLGVPFVSCLTTKISHHWFQDRQRIWATTLLSLACPVGIVLGQAITPLIVPVSKAVQDQFLK
jgi:MFS family permease